MQKNRKIKILLAAMAVIALSGCVSKKPAAPKVYWPPPPGEPKMEWITSFSSEDSFPKSDRKIISDKLLGKERLDLLRKPMGLATDSRGVLYVADLDANNVRVIDFSKKTMSMYSEKASLGLPVGLAIDSQDNLYVADAGGKRVLVFSPQRTLVRSLGGGEFGKPTFIALDEGRGRVYVSDVVNHQVFVFDLKSGAKLFTFGSRGGGPGQLYGPQGIAIDKQGRIFVAEQFNTRIQVFDADGKHLYMFGQRGDRAFQFEGPRGLAFDSQDNLFVAEARKAAVLVFQPDGTPLTSLGGSRSVHLLGFTLPTGIYIDRNDRIYVSDGMNRRVTIWQMLTPAYLAEHPLDEDSLKMIEERTRRLRKQRGAQ